MFVVRKIFLPFFQLPAGVSNYPRTNFLYQSKFLCIRNKLTWIDQSQLRMVPADKSFKTNQPVRAQRNDRLIINFQFIILQCFWKTSYNKILSLFTRFNN